MGLHVVGSRVVHLAVDELVMLFKYHPSLMSPSGHFEGMMDFAFNLQQFVEAIIVLDSLDQEVEDFFLPFAVDGRSATYFNLFEVAGDGHEVSPDTSLPSLPFGSIGESVEFLGLQR